MMNSLNELSKSMRVVLTIIPYSHDFNPLKQAISHISIVSEISHFEIVEEVSTNILMKILVLLRDIESLQISSLIYSNPLLMTEKDIKVLSSFTYKNAIRKVYLKNMTKMAEIYFLIKLCPRMIYLKVDFLHQMNFELFVRLILMKINIESNHQLRLLCFHVTPADDQIIIKLNNMIHFEKLLTDYTIKRTGDDIYLQWK